MRAPLARRLQQESRLFLYSGGDGWRYADAGVSRIHVVHLDEAKAGKPCNLPSLERIASIGGLDVEWGGGVKTSSILTTSFQPE